MMELSIVVKATLILLLSFACLWLTRKASASLRSLFLAATFGILLVLPMATSLAPRTEVAIPIYRAPAPVRAVGPFDARHVVGQAVLPVDRPGVVASRAAVPFSTIDVRGWLLGLWMLGTVVFLVPMAMSMWRTHRLRRMATPWTPGTQLLRSCATEVGVNRRVELLSSEGTVVPLTCGLVRPAIVLPADAGNWSDAEIRHALVHELEHVQRADWAVLFMARAASALYWFHPLIWIAWRRLRLEAERACDDAVLRGAERTAYADQLVALARRVSGANPVSALSMASRSDLANRISALLDPEGRRSRAGRISMTLTCTAAVAVLLAVASVQTVAQSQATTGARQTDQATNTRPATIAGIVYDPYGRPLANLRLGLEGFTAGVGFIVLTDARGYYSFDAVPSGRYGLSAPTTDFVEPVSLFVSPGEQLKRDIRLKIEAYTEKVTVCATCAADTYELPDSLVSELEHDRETESTQPVRGAEPAGGLEQYQPALRPYPPALAGSQLQGIVVVEGRIGADGLPKDLWVVSADHPELGAAALEVLEARRWEPAHVLGVRIEVPLHMTFEYGLSR